MPKGSSFEREICVLLSKWWTKGQRDDIFYRSNASGARFTQRKKVGKDTAYQSGDVTFTDPSGELLIKEWNIEAKTGYGDKKKIKDKSGNIIAKVQERWDLLDCLDSAQNEPVLWKMWSQCERDAKLSNRHPILIFRRNLRKTLIVFQMEYYLRLVEYYGENDCNIVSINKIVMLKLTDFFEWVPDIRKALTKIKTRR